MIAFDVMAQMPHGYRAMLLPSAGPFDPPMWCGESPGGVDQWWRATPEAVITIAWAHYEGREWQLVAEPVIQQTPVDLWLRAFKIDPARGRTMEHVRR